ncbi:transcription factor TFIIS [Halomontanus rarus]|uniref:transcription factor TFIIS n=1 Tax=Halomontanus rarus TaxID=3034020 RepID=UPI00293BB268|nr:transcription factor TFIIS [Halovivax sp. KZCA124]
MSIDDSSSISGIARNQQAVSVDGSLEGIFEPDGSLRPATRIVETGGEESMAAWLEAVAPDRLATIDERVDELPATRTELLDHHVQKILEEAEHGQTVAPTPDLETSTLVITYHQRERGPIVAESTGDDLEGGSMVDCPKCGETVEMRTELKQLRSADESETRIHHGTCGCTWRDDD